MASKKVIISTVFVLVVTITVLLFVLRPALNDKPFLEPYVDPYVEPQVTYLPILDVNGYESNGYWTRNTATDLPDYISTIRCSVSNVGNSTANEVNFEIRIDGDLFKTEFFPSLAVWDRQTYTYTVTMPYDSSRTIEVKTWCSESSDISTFSVEHNFPRYLTEDASISKLFITPRESNVVWRENQILEDKFFLTPNWIAIRDWVGNNIQYKEDDVDHGKPEYWQFGTETLSRRTGDCEDFSILLCSLLRANGWSANDVYVVLGKNDDGYHGWVKINMGILGWYNLEPQGSSWNLVIGDFIMLSGYTPIYQFNDVQVQKLG